MLEQAEPGSGLAGEEERIKAEKAQRANHLRKFEEQKRRAEGHVMGIREKEMAIEQGKIKVRQQHREELDRKLAEQRSRNVGIGNTRVYTGHMDHQQSGNRDGQLLEGEGMEHKRARAREREEQHRSKAEETERKEEERQRKLEERVERRRRRSELLKHQDLVKEEIRDEALKYKQRVQRAKEQARKSTDGDDWSAAQALTAAVPSAAPLCHVIPSTFAQDSAKEDRKLNEAVRQRALVEERMQQMRMQADQRRPRIHKLLNDTMSGWRGPGS